MHLLETYEIQAAQAVCHSLSSKQIQQPKEQCPKQHKRHGALLKICQQKRYDDSDFDMEYECKLNFILVAKIESETMMCRTRKHTVAYFSYCFRAVGLIIKIQY